MRQPSGALAPLRIPAFRLLLGGFAIGQMLMPLQFITQIIWVQETAPDDIWLILVAFIGASRGVGALTFGLYPFVPGDILKLLVVAGLLPLGWRFIARRASERPGGSPDSA